LKMKTAVAFAVLAAIMVCVAAQAPVAQTPCEQIMSALASATPPSAVTNQAEMIKVVVGAAVTELLKDISIRRYFAGAPYAPIIGNSGNTNALVGKLNSWFFTALACSNKTDNSGVNITAPVPLDLTASHVALKISKRDASVFNRIVAGAAGGVLTSQNVPAATVSGLGAFLVNTLDTFIPQVLGGNNNARTSICDRFTDSLTTLLLSGNQTLTNSTAGFQATESFKGLVPTNGINFAFWATFVDWFVIKGGIVSNNTIAGALLPYFAPPIARIQFTDITGGSGSNYNALIRKLAAYFGVVTGCSDVEFAAVAEAAGGVFRNNGVLAAVNLTSSHHYLYIKKADSDLFNGVIAGVAKSVQGLLNGIISGSMTDADLGTIVTVLNSVESQVVNPNPRPQPVAAPVANNTPRPAPTAAVTAPRSSATTVVASGFVVLAASVLALLL